MAPFDRIEDSDGRVRVDWHLMQNGAVTLFGDRAEFGYATAWLKKHEYVVHKIDFTDWSAFVDQLSDSLDFVDQFGLEWNGNLDALNDGFGSVVFDRSAGVAFAFDQYDRLAAEDYQVAHAVLDIIAWNSRFHLLFGERLLALVYSDDPGLRFDSLGAQGALWNNIRWVRPNSE